MCSLLNHIKVSTPFFPDQDKIKDVIIFNSQWHSSVYCLQIKLLFLKFHLDWYALQCAFYKHGIREEEKYISNCSYLQPLCSLMFEKCIFVCFYFYQQVYLKLQDQTYGVPIRLVGPLVCFSWKWEMGSRELYIHMYSMYLQCALLSSCLLMEKIYI